jgi:16S rRNA (uracil1498-N3)-methyltransferase
MARFFLRQQHITGNSARITGQELEHLRRVLRLGPGDRVTGFDQSGWEHEAVIRSLTVDSAELEIIRSYPGEKESPVAVTLAVGLIKGDKMDFVVEKATELGVNAIAPFTSTYTVPKLDAVKAKKRKERWEKIALSAAKQCGRAQIPVIVSLRGFPEMVQQSRPDDVKLLFWEKGRDLTLNGITVAPRSILVAVGAEGGFSEAEADLASKHGFKLIGLGPRILRAETAALTALALVQFRWGDLG